MNNKKIKIRQKGEKNWLYSDNVKKHFFNPQNILFAGEEEKYKADAWGKVGSPACGDEMIVFLKIDPKTEKIIDFRWQTFGCGSAIASTSALSVMVLEKKMTIDEALKITPKDITENLGGLPSRKIHCSVLGDRALQKAINNWFIKTGQKERVELKGQKIIDEKNKISEEMIEDLVLDGIKNLKEIKVKLALKNDLKELDEKIQNLINRFIEKYYD